MVFSGSLTKESPQKKNNWLELGFCPKQEGGGCSMLQNIPTWGILHGEGDNKDHGQDYDEDQDQDD